MKKTTRATELSGWNSTLIGQKYSFSGQSAGRNSISSGTGSVRTSSRGSLALEINFRVANNACAKISNRPGSKALGFPGCSFLGLDLDL